ncbi:hypothetical protein [Embleya sp. AB8]|uniref:hypothetical protein n=1 Tax=Embleya sp. AB8 TaxID=3156304 RepID=UPI003C7434D5
MNEWELWRQDDNGARFRIRGYADRVAAIAGRLVIESGIPHKQLYWVAGPRVPSCPTLAATADLIQALPADRDPSTAAFLAAFDRVGASLRDDGPLDFDTIAAVFRAAWDTVESEPAGGRESEAEDGSRRGGDPAHAPDLDRARDRLDHAAAALRTRDPHAALRGQDLVGLVAHVPHRR